jgi:hypothetical protein
MVYLVNFYARYRIFLVSLVRWLHLPTSKGYFNTTSTVFTTLVHQLYNYPRILMRKKSYLLIKPIHIVKYFIIYF